MEIIDLDPRDSDDFMVALGIAHGDPEAIAEGDRRWPDGYSDYVQFLIDTFNRRPT